MMNTLNIDDKLLDTAHTIAAKTLGNAMISGDFNDFESILSNDVESILHESKTFYGKKDVIEYWRGWRERWVVTKKVTKFHVKHSCYYFSSCLQMGPMLVLFMMNETRISKIVLVPRHISNGTYTHHDDLVKEYPFSLEYIRQYTKPFSEAAECFSSFVKEHRLPCFCCGAKSESLEWYSADINVGVYAYPGVVSICPKCGKVVEYVTQSGYIMETPIPDEYAVLEDYASCWNELVTYKLEDHLCDDFKYSSFWVFEELDKEGYIKYFANKLQKIAETGFRVKAKVEGRLLVANQDGNNFVIDVKFDKGKIVRADMMPASFYGIRDKENSHSNIYSDVALEFHKLLKSSVIKSDDIDKGEVFTKLSSLKLEDGLHLGLRLANEETGSLGDESNFYIYDEAGNKDNDILKSLLVEPTTMSAWQTYLLMTSPTVMPTFWHGAYNERTFILKEEDLEYIAQLKKMDLSAMKNSTRLTPAVTIEKSAYDNKYTVHIFCCFWNNWKGLVREHATIVMKDNKIESFESKEDMVLYCYHCGIYF